MTGQTLRVNLASANFPLLSSENGRSAIFTSQGEMAADGTTGISSKYQQSLPQPIYLSNILPTTKGLTSVKLVPDEKPVSVGLNLPTNVNLHIIKDNEDRRVYYLAHPRYNYIYDSTEETWTTHLIDIAEGTEVVTIAYLKEHTYIFIEGIGCYEYNILDKVFTSVDLKGLTPANLKGVTVGGGVLVVYDDSTIYWSSVTDPTDFVPNPITGAGSTKVLAIKSLITLCSAVTDGFIIYTAHNAVLAISTADLIVPFIYKEIENFAGVTNIAETSYGSSADAQYCWTSAGLIKINGATASIIHPEVTEFLSSKVLEQYDYDNNTFKITLYDKPVSIKVRTIGNRFFTISYGQPFGVYYTHILIFDMPLQRWGKLELNHIDVFDYAVTTPYTADRFNQYPIPANDPTVAGRTADSFSTLSLQYTDPAKEIGIVTYDGVIMTAVPDSVGTIGHLVEQEIELPTKEGEPLQNSLAVMGDYALTRTQFSQMQALEIDTMGTNSEVKILSYLKYENATPVSTFPIVDETDKRKYWSEASGRFHRVLVRGEFFLSTILICIDGEGEL